MLVPTMFHNSAARNKSYPDFYGIIILNNCEQGDVRLA